MAAMYGGLPTNQRGQSEKTVSIQRCTPLANGEKEEHKPESVVFNNEIPLDEQMEGICRRFALDYDEEDYEGDYYVLVSDADAKSENVQVVRTTHHLINAGAKRRVLGLWKATDLVESRLAGLRESLKSPDLDTTKLLKQFEQLFGLIHLQDDLLYIIAESDAMKLIWQAVIRVQAKETEIVEIVMGIACLLISNETTIDVIFDLLDDDEEAPVFFRVVLEVLATLPPMEEMHTAKRPYATLAFLTAVLEGVDGSAFIVHAALNGCEASEEEQELPSMYEELVKCVLDEGEDQFLNSAGSILLYCLCLRAQAEGESGDADFMYAIMDVLDELDREDREVSLWEECTDTANLATEFVFLQTYSAADMAAIAVRRPAGSDDKESKLQKRLNEMTMRKEELEKMVKKQQTSMKSLAPFVAMGEPGVQSAVSQILKFGWEALEFENGYTILHYAAEKVSDPLVAEVLFNFMPTPEVSDKNGMTALDYAQQASSVGVAKKLMQLSPVFERAGAGLVSPEVDQEELRARLAKLNVPQNLKGVLTDIVEKGWHEIKWPGGYTALHLAAQKGNVQILDFCMAAGAAESLTSIDQYNHSPMNYAVQHRHEEVIQKIQQYLDAEKRTQAAAAKAASKQQEAANKDSLPADLDPKLRAAVDAVLDRGWSRLKWPNGYNALHLAAGFGSVPAIKVLLEASAEPGLNQRDNHGKVPLAYAEEKHFGEDVIELLRPKMEKGDSVSSFSFMLATEESTSQVEETDVVKLQAEVKQLRTKVGRREGIGPGGAGVSVNRYMSDETFLTYLGIFQARGAEEVIAKLNGPKLTGGLELSDVAALDALEQIKFVAQMLKMRIQVEVENYSKQGIGVAQHANTSDPNGMTKAALNSILRGGPKGAPKPLAAQDMQLCAKCGGPAGQPGLQPAFSSNLESISEQGTPTSGKGAKGKGKGKGASTAAADGKGADSTIGAGKGADSAGGPGGGKPAAKGSGGKGGASKGSGPSAGGAAKAKPKAKGAGKVKPTKPEIKPAKKMQALWWGDAMFFGGRIKPGMVWDDVPDYTDDIPMAELTFLFTTEKEMKGRPDVPDKGEKKKKEAKEVKMIEIITDQQALMTSTMAFQALVCTECAQALDDLDDEALTPEDLESLKLYGCPTEVQLAQLQDLREKHPTLPMGKPEEFMWVFGHLKRARERLEIWSFIRNSEEPMDFYQSRIREFESICDAVLKSKPLRHLFGLILAIGNYMNGGTNRGRYDGFDVVKTLDQLTSSKDKNGHTLAEFILRTFMEKNPDSFKAFITDMQPVFLNVSKRIKQVEGADFINKNPRISLEDYEPLVNGIKKESDQANASLNLLLKEFKDATDPFRLRMPAMLRRTVEAVDNLVTMRDAVKTKYDTMLNLLGLDAKMKGADFCILIDDFIVPNFRLLSFDEEPRSRFIVPNFCADRAFTGNDVLVLWGIRPYEQPKAKKEGQGKNKEKHNKDQWKKKKKAAGGAGPGISETISHSHLPSNSGDKSGPLRSMRGSVRISHDAAGSVPSTLPHAQSVRTHQTERTWRSHHTGARSRKDGDGDETATPTPNVSAGHKSAKKMRKRAAKARPIKPIKEGSVASFTGADSP